MTKTIEKTEMTEFEKLFLDSYDRTFKVADIVEGTIMEIAKNGVIVDIKAKTEAVIPFRELSNVPFENAEDLVKIGETKELYVLREANEEGQVLLSLKKVSLSKSWKELDQLRSNNETITAKIAALVKGGVVVEILGLRGFVPASQLRTGTPHEGMIDQEIKVKILETDPKRNKLILSQRQALAEERERVVEKVISELTVDQVVEGEVVRIADFGAFIDINGVDGLLPISEISWQRVKHPSDVISLGQKLEIKVLKIDTELKRISLSLKRMGENPWVKIEDQFKEGDVITGTVNKITNFGAFVSIFPGVEALLPAAEMSNEQVNPFNEVSVGQEIEVLIKRFTPQEHRIGLSTRDLSKAKAEAVEQPEEQPQEAEEFSEAE